MQDINKKINNKPVIGKFSLKGTVYYVDIDKTIYTCKEDKYEVVQDRETLQSILDYISPKSIDLEI